MQHSSYPGGNTGDEAWRRMQTGRIYGDPVVLQEIRASPRVKEDAMALFENGIVRNSVEDRGEEIEQGLARSCEFMLARSHRKKCNTVKAGQVAVISHGVAHNQVVRDPVEQGSSDQFDTAAVIGRDFVVGKEVHAAVVQGNPGQFHGRGAIRELGILGDKIKLLLLPAQVAAFAVEHNLIADKDIVTTAPVETDTFLVIARDEVVLDETVDRSFQVYSLGTTVGE